VASLIDGLSKKAGLSEKQLRKQVAELGIYISESMPLCSDLTIDQLSGLFSVLGASLEIGWNPLPPHKPLPPYREPYCVEGDSFLYSWISCNWGALHKPADRLALYPAGAETRYWYDRTDRKWVDSNGIERTVFVWTGEECD